MPTGRVRKLLAKPGRHLRYRPGRDGAEVVLSTVAVNLPTNARAKPARASANFQKKSWSSKMTRCSKSLGALKTRHCSIRRSPTNGEGGIRTRGPAFDRTRL